MTARFLKPVSDDELRAEVRAFLKEHWKGLPHRSDQWTVGPEQRA